MFLAHVLVRHVGPPKFACSQVLHANPLGSLLRPVRRNLLPPIITLFSRAPTSGALLSIQASQACPNKSSVLLRTHICDGKLLPSPSSLLLLSHASRSDWQHVIVLCHQLWLPAIPLGHSSLLPIILGTNSWLPRLPLSFPLLLQVLRSSLLRHVSSMLLSRSISGSLLLRQSLLLRLLAKPR